MSSSWREAGAEGDDRLDIRALIPARLLPDLDEAISASRRNGTGHEGVLGHLRVCQFAEHEIRLCMLAYSLWRGTGPALSVSALWGMDRRLATRLIAGLAAAIEPDDCEGLLEEAKVHLRTLTEEDVEDPPTD